MKSDSKSDTPDVSDLPDVTESATASEYDVTRINTPDPFEKSKTATSLTDAEKGADSAGFPVPETGFHRVGVAFEGVTVYGAGSSHRGVESFEIAALRMWDIISLLKRFAGIKSGPKRAIISEFYGLCRPGESMLVLGRPGSGCSTLLRTLANDTVTFSGTDGHIQWGNIHGKDAKHFAGDFVFNNEEDIHIPILTVGQTLDTDLSLKKAPHMKTGGGYNSDRIDKLLNALGMIHTKDTLVGDSFIRGVSGGERKRVSLLEMLTTNAAVISWDNCVRGLDSSVALHFLRLIKRLGRETGITNIVSIYQASQDMYDECFDRVVVIYDGRMVFSGRTTDAETFFLNQGWYKKPHQTTADFLTACTSPSERKATKAGVPQTPDEMAAYFRASPEFAKLQAEIAQYKAESAASDDTELFRVAVKESRAPLAGHGAYKGNFLQQVASLCVRQTRLTIADRATFLVRVLSNTLNATCVGAMAYNSPKNAAGSFTIAGAIFFTILYFVIFGFGEVAATVQSRPLQIKHRKLGFYHPGAVVIAQMIVDVPLYAIQTLIFSSIYYFLVGLNAGARYFFTFWFVTFTVYMAVSNMYRAIGSWSPNLSVAVRYGGLALGVVLAAAGYLLPLPYQLRWISWLGRTTPSAYALEALLANEFRMRTLVCAEHDMVPNGPEYTNPAYQTCSITGGTPGSATVSGLDYILAKYNFSDVHIWRNIGIIWAMYALYAILVIWGASLLVTDAGASATKIFKRGAKVEPAPAKTEKEPLELELYRSHENAGNALVRDNLTRHSTRVAHGAPAGQIFTFKDVTYTVKVPSGDKQLLNKVSGKVMPGQLTALMGASGAGKTTLLDVISQRKTSGTIEGQFSLGGAPLDSTFGRKAGFCMQADLHDPFATVRECLEFSALMRQDASFSREEKLAYVDEVIDLLELGPIQDALIGSPDIGGLGIEERKRVTIGVELAARPESLLFLDEPTSGLDSQAAYEIVTFLKKIAKAAGLSVLCTIHQPSGDLFDMFDSVVLLAPGGSTVYAGETGRNAKTVCDYFGRLGAPCPAKANPAEHILATVAPVGGSKIDWPGLWRESPEAQQLLVDIDAVAGSGAAEVGVADEKATVFAAPYVEQCRELLRRHFRWQWRNGSYLVSRFATAIFFGLFLGFYFYKLDPTAVGIQALSISQIVIMQSAPPLMIDIALFYQAQFDLFIARERNGIYSWQALVTSIMIVELPATITSGLATFFCYFWTVGLDTSPEVGGLTFLTWFTWSFFVSTCGVLLGAVCPNPFSIAYILSYFWNIYMALSNAFFSYYLMPSPFHYFFNWLSPLRYYFAAMLSNVSTLTVKCLDKELVRFNIPDGHTCASYAASFMTTAVGYLANPNDTSNCGYCEFSKGEDYMNGTGYHYNQRWRDWGLGILFIVSNIAVAYGMTYMVRIRPLYK